MVKSKVGEQKSQVIELQLVILMWVEYELLD